MYTLYTDKSESFKCNIDVEGANISKTKARLILESKDLNLMFEGKLNSDGSCIIPIKQLKNILQEGSKGTMRLEVIAEDTFFSPWKDDFKVKTNKKVTVEVKSNTDKELIKETQIKVEVVKSKPEIDRSHSNILSELLGRKGVRLSNIDSKLTTTTNLIEKYVKRYNVDEDLNTLLQETISKLK